MNYRNLELPVSWKKKRLKSCDTKL